MWAMAAQPLMGLTPMIPTRSVGSGIARADVMRPRVISRLRTRTFRALRIYLHLQILYSRVVAYASTVGTSRRGLLRSDRRLFLTLSRYSPGAILGQ